MANKPMKKYSLGNWDTLKKNQQDMQLHRHWIGKNTLVPIVMEYVEQQLNLFGRDLAKYMYLRTQKPQCTYILRKTLTRVHKENTNFKTAVFALRENGKHLMNNIRMNKNCERCI